MMKFKRVKYIEFDRKSNIWQYFLEERWCHANEKVDGTLFQLFEHFEGLNNINALLVKDLLRKWINYLSKMLKGETGNNPNIQFQEGMKVEEPGNLIKDPSRMIEKRYFNEFVVVDGPLLEYIKRKPFIRFTEEYNHSY